MKFPPDVPHWLKPLADWALDNLWKFLGIVILAASALWWLIFLLPF